MDDSYGRSDYQSCGQESLKRDYLHRLRGHQYQFHCIWNIHDWVSCQPSVPGPGKGMFSNALRFARTTAASLPLMPHSINPHRCISSSLCRVPVECQRRLLTPSQDFSMPLNVPRWCPNILIFNCTTSTFTIHHFSPSSP